MKLAIVSDEISLDFDEATRYGLEWGIQDYELRCLTSGRVPFVAEDELENVVKLQRQRGIRIRALSPGVFKISLADGEQLEWERREILSRTYHLAERLGATKILLFGIVRKPEEPESHFQRVVDFFGAIAEEARARGLLLLIENEPGFWCDTGVNTARVLRAVNSENLKANWDPGNALLAGEVPYPNGYRAICEFIRNVHVKDTRLGEGGKWECYPVGEGRVDWRGQLQALVRETDLEYVTIETHCLPLIEKSRLNVERVTEILRSNA